MPVLDDELDESKQSSSEEDDDMYDTSLQSLMFPAHRTSANKPQSFVFGAFLHCVREVGVSG